MKKASFILTVFVTLTLSACVHKTRARAVFEMGVPTPEPLQLVTDGERRGVEYELIRDKRSLPRLLPSVRESKNSINNPLRW